MSDEEKFGMCAVYCDAIGEGDIVTRSLMAARMGVSITTARYHLDRATEFGLLNRAYGWIGNQRGWLYASPATMPRLLA